jgi:hypothetical protein
VISAFLIVWITLASGRFNLRSALFLLVLPCALLRAGGIISAATGLRSFFPLDFLLGVSVVSVVILAWKVFVPLSLWVVLIIVPWRACDHSWISLVPEVIVYFVIRHLDFVIPFICVHSWPHVTP